MVQRGTVEEVDSVGIFTKSIKKFDYKLPVFAPMISCTSGHVRRWN